MGRSREEAASGGGGGARVLFIYYCLMGQMNIWLQKQPFLTGLRVFLTPGTICFRFSNPKSNKCINLVTKGVIFNFL